MEHAASPAALRRFRLIAAAGLLGAGAGMATACGQGGETTVTQRAELEREIAAALPTGSSIDAVTAWLAARGFGHSGLIDNAALAHMGADPATYELKSILRGDRGTIVRTDTQLSFVFGRDRRLIAARVTPVHTGP
jgi:hypothetical protein